MFGLLNRSSRIRKPLARRTTTLCLERLEDRLSPAGLASDGLTMNVTYLPGKEATFSGQLTNQSGGGIAGATIALDGDVKASTTTDSQGNYSITLAIPQLGSETATAVNLNANIGVVSLESGSPTISNFAAANLGDGKWSFSGTVTGAPTQGEVVNFDGIIPLQGQSVAVNSDGSFSFSATVTADESGTATAQAVDWWGDTSQIAMAAVNAT